MCTSHIFFRFAHRSPLERCERLRYKERRTCRDLTFSMSLVFWNLIISAGNLFRKMSNLDIEMTRNPAAVHRKGQQKTNMAGTKETQEMESYQVEEDGKTVIYSGTDEAWEKNAVEEKETSLSGLIERFLPPLSTELHQAPYTSKN